MVFSGSPVAQTPRDATVGPPTVPECLRAADFGLRTTSRSTIDIERCVSRIENTAGLAVHRDGPAGTVGFETVLKSAVALTVIPLMGTIQGYVHSAGERDRTRTRVHASLSRRPPY